MLRSSLLRAGAVASLIVQASLLPAADPPVRWSSAVLRQKPEWYASPEARLVGDSVLQYQSIHGAWPKNTELARPPSTPEALALIQQGGEANTIDNGATTTPMRFLALMAAANGGARYREAFTRGLDYLFASQYENGGWPQFFPLREGYYAHITYNDDAMVNVLTLLREVASGAPAFGFVDKDRQVKARAAVARGIDVILRTQIRQDGKLTAWCAQHDEKTLRPAWARKYEPPSLSGQETVGVARFLMQIDQPTSQIEAAIEGAVAWLRGVVIKGIRIEEFTGPDGKKDKRVVADPAAGPMWARFYELSTNRPIFLGRDSMIHYTIGEIEHERRNGYAYYGYWPVDLLERDYPRWLAKHKKSRANAS